MRERVLARAMGLASPEAAPIGGGATFYGCVQLLAWVLTAQPQGTQATATAIPAPRAAHAGAAPSFGTRNLGTANGSDAFAAACMGSLPDADVLQCVSMQIGSRLHAWQAGDEHAASFTNSTVQLQAGASQSVQLQCLGPWVPVVDSAESADSAAVRHADAAAPSGAQPEQATVEICLTSVQDTKVRLILVRDGVLLVDCTAELVQGMQVLDLPMPVQAHVGILQLAVMPLPTSQGTVATASHPTSSSMPLMYDSCMLLALPAAACNDLTSLLAAHMQHCQQHQQRIAAFPMHGMAACSTLQEATILDAAAWACAQLQPLLCDFGYVIEASSIAQGGLSESVASTASATASSLLRYMQDAGLHACASYVVALWGRVNLQAVSGTQAATSYAHPTTELPTEPRPWVHLHSTASAGSEVTHTYEEHTQQEQQQQLVHAHAEPLLHADPPSAPMPHAEATSDILPRLRGHHAALTQLNGCMTSDMRSAGGGAMDTERAGRLEPLTTCISADAAMPTLNVLMESVPGVSLRVRTSSSSTETSADSMHRMIKLG